MKSNLLTNRPMVMSVLGMALVSAIHTNGLATPIPLSKTTTQMQIANVTPEINDIDLEKLKQALPKQADIDRMVQDSMSDILNAIKHYHIPDDMAERAHQDARFPMRSHLTLGHVDAKRVALLGNVPAFFVIGDDAFSIDWFHKHEAYLKEPNAIGLITNIDSKARFDSLKAELDIDLHPVNLSQIEDYLPVAHYPFWVANGKIGQ